MRNYPLHDLNDGEFEQLTILLCEEILGAGVIPFAKGPDGGRDGRFHGKANKLPSASKPWEGQVVIQAKHTMKLNATCSDGEFTTILKNEVLPAIENLKSAGKIRYYLLFTNRKLTGKQDAKIEDLIALKSGIENLVIANEKIQEWLRFYPHIVRAAKLNDLLRPLQFDESDLKAVVVAIANTLSEKYVSSNNSYGFTSLNLEYKNELNNLGEDHFRDVMKRNMIEFDGIERFLSDPINQAVKRRFQDAADEINAKISLHRSDYVAFEHLLQHLYELVVEKHPDIVGNKRLVRVLLHYMYCNCEIGRTEA
jgi:hypothetical protein